MSISMYRDIPLKVVWARSPSVSWTGAGATLSRYISAVCSKLTNRWAPQSCRSAALLSRWSAFGIQPRLRCSRYVWWHYRWRLGPICQFQALCFKPWFFQPASRLFLLTALVQYTPSYLPLVGQLREIWVRSLGMAQSDLEPAVNWKPYWLTQQGSGRSQARLWPHERSFPDYSLHIWSRTYHDRKCAFCERPFQVATGRTHNECSITSVLCKHLQSSIQEYFNDHLRSNWFFKVAQQLFQYLAS